MTSGSSAWCSRQLVPPFGGTTPPGIVACCGGTFGGWAFVPSLPGGYGGALFGAPSTLRDYCPLQKGLPCMTLESQQARIFDLTYVQKPFYIDLSEVVPAGPGEFTPPDPP